MVSTRVVIEGDRAKQKQGRGPREQIF